MVLWEAQASYGHQWESLDGTGVEAVSLDYNLDGRGVIILLPRRTLSSPRCTYCNTWQKVYPAIHFGPLHCCSLNLVQTSA